MGGGEDSIKLKTGIDVSGFKAGSKQLDSAVKSLGKNVQSTMSKAVRTGKSVLGTIKKWGPALLGIGGAYQVISKAVHTFMAQNEELSAKMNSIWTALGNVLGPIIERIVNWIADAISYLLSFLKLLGLTGKTASQLSQSAKKAGSELRKTIAGFDELNLLQGNSGGGGANGSLADKEPPAWMQELVNSIKSGQWGKVAEMASDAVIAALNKLADAISSFDWKKLGAAIHDFFANIKYEQIADAIFNLLKSAWKAAIRLLWGLLAGDTEEKPPIIASLERLGDAFENLYKGVKKVVKKVLEEVISPLFGVAVDDILPKTIDFLADVIDKLGRFCQEHGDIVSSVFGSIIAFVLGSKLAEGILAIKDAVILMTNAFNPWVVIAIAVGAALLYLYNHCEGFRKIVDSVAAWFVQKWEEIKQWWSKVKEDPGKAFKEIGLSIWNGLKEGIGDFLNELYLIFVKPIEDCIDWIKEKLGIHSPSAVLKDIGSNMIQGLWNGATEKWNAFWSWIQGKWSGLKQWWENLRLNPFNIMLPHLTWGSRQVSGWLAKTLSTLGLPSALPTLSVRWYKKGGVFDKPTTIGVGEDGEEAVMPIEKNTEWIDKLALKLMSSMQAITDKVTFRMPALAAGDVTPYSVASKNDRQAQEGGYGLGDVINAISSLKAFLNASDDSDRPIVLQVFLDGEQIETVVTRRQKEKNRARGK